MYTCIRMRRNCNYNLILGEKKCLLPVTSVYWQTLRTIPGTGGAREVTSATCQPGLGRCLRQQSAQQLLPPILLPASWLPVDCSVSHAAVIASRPDVCVTPPRVFCLYRKTALVKCVGIFHFGKLVFVRMEQNMETAHRKAQGLNLTLLWRQC